MMMRTILGVDGGASKTHALLLDEKGHLLGFGQAGSGNHQMHGLEAAVEEIRASIQAVIRDARLSSPYIDAGCFCLAGADLPDDYTMLQEAMLGLNLVRQVTIKNDAFAALRAGLTRSWGVVVICGTGFNAAARAMDGQEIVLPGLGSISGDWGGGGTLSMEMIRMVMRAWDGRGKPTRLTRVVLQQLEVQSEEQLLHQLYHKHIPQQRILDLVPFLFEAAEAGDDVARELIVQLGTEAGITAKALIRRAGLAAAEVEVVLGGSVFKGKGALLVDTVQRVIHEEYPGAQIKRTRYEPVVGAALLGLESIGVTVDEEVYRRLEAALPGELITSEEVYFTPSKV